MELKDGNDQCDYYVQEESMTMDSSDECYSGDDCDDEEPEDDVNPKDEIRQGFSMVG